MSTNYIIKWENKFSAETGLVKKINKGKGYFENTYNVEEAKSFKTKKGAENAIETLKVLKDAENNTYCIVSIEKE